MVMRLMNDKLLRKNGQDSSARLINAVPRVYGAVKRSRDDLPPFLFLSLSLFLSLFLPLSCLRLNSTGIFYVIIIYVDRSRKNEMGRS